MPKRPWKGNPGVRRPRRLAEGWGGGQRGFRRATSLDNPAYQKLPIRSALSFALPKSNSIRRREAEEIGGGTRVTARSIFRAVVHQPNLVEPETREIVRSDEFQKFVVHVIQRRTFHARSRPIQMAEQHDRSAIEDSPPFIAVVLLPRQTQQFVDDVTCAAGMEAGNLTPVSIPSISVIRSGDLPSDKMTTLSFP